MARGILDSLMSATYFNASALRLLRQLVIISFWKISLSKVDSKEFMFFAPRWQGEQILTSKCRWRRALVWGADILQYIPSQPGWWPLSNWSTSSASSSWIFYGTDIHYQHHYYQWYEMILNDIKYDHLQHIVPQTQSASWTDCFEELSVVSICPARRNVSFFPYWLVKNNFIASISLVGKKTIS